MSDFFDEMDENLPRAGGGFANYKYGESDHDESPFLKPKEDPNILADMELAEDDIEGERDEEDDGQRRIARITSFDVGRVDC